MTEQHEDDLQKRNHSRANQPSYNRAKPSKPAPEFYALTNRAYDNQKTQDIDQSHKTGGFLPLLSVKVTASQVMAAAAEENPTTKTLLRSFVAENSCHSCKFVSLFPPVQNPSSCFATSRLCCEFLTSCIPNKKRPRKRRRKPRKPGAAASVPALAGIGHHASGRLCGRRGPAFDCARASDPAVLERIAGTRV